MSRESEMSDASNTPRIGADRRPPSPPEEQIRPYLYTEQCETPLTAMSGDFTNWTTEELPFLRPAPAGMPMQRDVADRAACAWLQQRLASRAGAPHELPRNEQELHRRISDPTQQGIRSDARAARQGQSLAQPRVVNRGPEIWGPAPSPPHPGDIPPDAQAPPPPWRAGRPPAAAPPAGGGLTLGGNRLPKLPPNFIL